MKKFLAVLALVGFTFGGPALAQDKPAAPSADKPAAAAPAADAKKEEPKKDEAKKDEAKK